MSVAPRDYEPREPGHEWPAETWLRRFGLLATVGFLLALPHAEFLALIAGLIAYNAARREATLRRKHGTLSEVRWWWHQSYREGKRIGQRWGWRLSWLIVIFYVGYRAGYGRGVLLLLAGASTGWTLAQFVDARSAEGTQERTVWQGDHLQFEKAFEEECNWASPFPSYRAYRDARGDERSFRPLSRWEFWRTRRGRASD